MPAINCLILINVTMIMATRSKRSGEIVRFMCRAHNIHELRKTGAGDYGRFYNVEKIYNTQLAIRNRHCDFNLQTLLIGVTHFINNMNSHRSYLRLNLHGSSKGFQHKSIHAFYIGLSPLLSQMPLIYGLGGISI